MTNQLDMKDYAAVAFDFDGTLADSISSHAAARTVAFTEMAEVTGDERFVQIPDEVHKEAHRHGSNPPAIIGWILKQGGVVMDIADDLVMQTVARKQAVYNRICSDGLPAIPGAIECVDAAQNLLRPNKTLITTTAHRDTEVLPFLERYNMRSKFSDLTLVTFENVGQDHLKPDPYAYKLAAVKMWLETSPEYLLAVEDTPAGITSAKGAGATAVAVCNTHSRNDFAGTEADFVFDNMHELLYAMTKPSQARPIVA